MPAGETPVVSCGEENMLGYRGDPYSTENILIHEFGHGIDGVGLRAVDPTFRTRLRKAFTDAMKKGLWKGTYAASNPGEYWAEAVQSWFDTNRQNDSQHNHVDTREELKHTTPKWPSYATKSSAMGPGATSALITARIRRTWPATIPPKLPSFRWEPELLEARTKHYEKVKRDSEESRAKDTAKSHRLIEIALRETAPRKYSS